jgi:hypothetical protein
MAPKVWKVLTSDTAIALIGAVVVALLVLAARG